VTPLPAPLTLVLIVAACAAVGIVLFIAGARRFRHRRIFSGGVHVLTALCFLLAAGAVGFLGAGLLTYQRLTQEQEAAQIRFQKVGDRAFDALVSFPARPPQHFELRGDEWQIDARVLKWRPVANLVGFDSAFRLDRLSGRYVDIHEERTAPRTVHSLSEAAPVDVWQLTRRYKQWLPWVDALYGSATFLPMADGAAYEIKVTQSGLIARPLNTAARGAIGAWQ
jgi:hypothetical protein